MIKKPCYFLMFFIVFLCGQCLNGEDYSPHVADNQELESINPSSSSELQSKQVLEDHQLNKPHETKNYFDVKLDDKDTDRFFHEFINMLTTLGLIVAIVLLATWYFKKMLSTKVDQLNTTSQIKVIERRVLSPKVTVYLLDVKGEGIILAESATDVTRLGNFEVKSSEHEPRSKASFNEVMEK